MIEANNKHQLTKVKDYYSHCWLNRFEEGHNPISLAMHMGYFDSSTTSNDEAKLNLNKFLFTSLNIGKNDNFKIADLGCGFGGTCIYLALNFPNSNVTGVNFASDQIAFARKKVQEFDLQKQVTFLEEDYTNTSLPGNQFDFAIAIESFCHADDKAAFLSEAQRILKPGGVLVILDYQLLSAPEGEKDKNLLQAFEDGWAVPHFVFKPETLLNNLGFESIEIKNISANIRPGINLSNMKAMEYLNNGKQMDEIFAKHLRACMALKELFDKEIIEYFFLTARKPVS